MNHSELAEQHPDDEICLVSLSKGGTDLQYALTEPGAEDDFQNVSTWINVSGIVQGTALANWLLGQWWRSLLIRAFAWWRRYPFDVLHEIKRDDNARLENALAWPAHLRVYHVISFPLRRHMSNPWAQRAHRRLEAWGPSDGGGILLADAVRWPGHCAALLIIICNTIAMMWLRCTTFARCSRFQPAPSAGWCGEENAMKIQPLLPPGDPSQPNRHLQERAALRAAHLDDPRASRR